MTQEVQSTLSELRGELQSDVLPVIEITRFALESIRPPERGSEDDGKTAEALYHSCELSAQRGEFVLLLGPSAMIEVAIVETFSFWFWIPPNGPWVWLEVNPRLNARWQRPPPPQPPPQP